MPRPARVSPDRILAAAAVEFAEHGFAGARVDRIARRARVNKAMLYYHFGSKQHLYRALLRATFAQAAAGIEAIAKSSRAPEDKLDAAIAALATFVATHSHFPGIMLREVAEGGAHLDAETLAALAAVPRAFGSIVEAGVTRGTFRPVHPLTAYFTTIAPIMMFVASTPVRKRLSSRRLVAADASLLTLDPFVRDLQESLRRAFAASPTAGDRS
jgi:TetR/AcrR family transcriptional regulator